MSFSQSITSKNKTTYRKDECDKGSCVLKIHIDTDRFKYTSYYFLNFEERKPGNGYYPAILL
ncbi:hypothetical protein HG66A1_42650 [Gimesia chilikensis]|uniref:Uncharacterized protein n=1 Tax=Gimesia chilikensis TaxID=2605989 RepID=A0A517PSV5_9PLAN|nr:hypothetical protein HG66A1_42650 [Gimesia chilikensis]